MITTKMRYGILLVAVCASMVFAESSPACLFLVSHDASLKGRSIEQVYGTKCFEALSQYFDGSPVLGEVSIVEHQRLGWLPIVDGGTGVVLLRRAVTQHPVHFVLHMMQFRYTDGLLYSMETYFLDHVTPSGDHSVWEVQARNAVNGFIRIYGLVCGP